MIAGPKELQPWIREKNRQIEDLGQQIRILDRKLGDPAVTRPFAVNDAVVLSSAGSTGANYSRATNVNTGPEVTMLTAGPVIVSLSVHMRGVWENTSIDAVAIGSMAVLVDGTVPADLGGLAQQWACTDFVFRVGHTSDVQERTVTVRRPVIVTSGSHNFRCTYVFRHITNGIHLEWSNRSIIVETV